MENPEKKHQHTVPQFHLNLFSKTADPYKLWMCSTDGNTIPQHKSVEKICYTNYFYEFRKYSETIRKGEIILPNAIENTLCVYEAKIAPIFRKIINCAIDKNVGKHILSTTEKQLLIVHSVLQLVRTPKAFKIYGDLIDSLCGDKLTDLQKQNLTRAQLLPIYRNMENDEQNFFIELVKRIDNHVFVIGKTNNDYFPICDNPSIFCEVEDDEEFNEWIILPINPRVVLFIANKESIAIEHRNSIFNLNEELIDFIKLKIVSNADQWIYFQNEPSEADLKLIEEVWALKGNK